MKLVRPLLSYAFIAVAATQFLNGCRKLGVAEHSMFSTADLFEVRALTALAPRR